MLRECVSAFFELRSSSPKLLSKKMEEHLESPRKEESEDPKQISALKPIQMCTAYFMELIKFPMLTACNS